mmetsp:Transcript_17515/g.47768  ORF Transcript_17515/g.47768 Transcript_17515/m.47768 type:complete len:201 (-) Transcript_17515:3583-4185(-)
MVNRNVGNKGLSKTAKYQGRSQLGRKNGYSCFPPISYHHQHPMRPYYHYYPPPPPAATATTQTMVTPPNYHPHYEYQPPLPSYHHQQGYHPGYVLSAPNDSQRQGPEAINSKQPTKKSTINRQPPPASGRGLDSEQGGTKNVSSSRSSSNIPSIPNNNSLRVLRPRLWCPWNLHYHRWCNAVWETVVRKNEKMPHWKSRL